MRYPGQHPRRAAVVGAGSFGTAVAVLLERAGVRTTLLCRTAEQAERLEAERENARYLPGVELPGHLRVRTLGEREDQFARADLIFLAVPSKGLAEALARAASAWASPSAPGSSRWPRAWCRRRGCRRRSRSSAPSAPSGWPASAVPRTRGRWSSPAPAWSAPRARSRSRTASPRPSSARAWSARSPTTRSASSWPGWPRTSAAVAVGATQAQGLNAAGHGGRRHLPRGARPGRAQRRHRPHLRRPRRHRRPGRDRAGADLAQPQRRRAARPGRAGGRRSRSASGRRSRRWRPCGCWRPRSSAPGSRRR